MLEAVAWFWTLTQHSSSPLGWWIAKGAVRGCVWCCKLQKYCYLHWFWSLQFVKSQFVSGLRVQRSAATWFFRNCSHFSSVLIKKLDNSNCYRNAFARKIVAWHERFWCAEVHEAGARAGTVSPPDVSSQTVPVARKRRHLYTYRAKCRAFKHGYGFQRIYASLIRDEMIRTQFPVDLPLH